MQHIYKKYKSKNTEMKFNLLHLHGLPISNK